MKLKILHIGGYPTIIKLIAEYQRDAGHAPKEIAALEGVFFPTPNKIAEDLKAHEAELYDGQYQIVHFHGAESVGLYFSTEDRAYLEECCRRWCSADTKLIYHAYGIGPVAAPNPNTQNTAVRYLYDILEKYFSHVFLGNPDELESIPNNIPRSWLPTPVTQPSTLPAPADYSKKERTSIIHIPYKLAPDETKLIIATLMSIKNKRYPVEFQIVRPEDIRTRDSLHQLLASTDIFIEKIQGKSYCPLALEALSLGRTVLSTNSSQSRDLWAHLAPSPVIDIGPQNLEERLMRILREPRCLKDLSHRSAKFTKSNHDPDSSNRIILEKYAALTSLLTSP